MSITTRGHYGLRIMLELASSEKNEPVMLKEIARTQELSYRYLYQLMSVLRNSGLVNSVRGSLGGFVLARPPREIRLGDLLQALEGGLAVVECVTDPRTCKRSADCVTREVWRRLTNEMIDFLNRSTLEDLVKMRHQKQAALMYHI